MVNTVKFSDFASGNINTTTNFLVGASSLSGGINIRIPFVTTWTTSGRPATPYAGLLGYNSTTGFYEYWDGSAWIPLNAGTGTVNPGLINELAWYAASGDVVSGLPTANNGVLTTDSGGVPGIRTTLPAGLTIPGYATIRGVQNQQYSYAPDTGTTNAYVIALTPSISSYTDGQFFGMTAASTNTGASTLNAGAGAVSIFNNDGSTLGANSILASGSYEFIYNGNFGGFVILNSSLDISGTGTVNPGLQNQVAWYAANGNVVSGLPTASNGFLVTDNTGAPSIGGVSQGLQISGSRLIVGAANNIPFNNGKGITDANNNPILLFTTTPSAVNYVDITNAATNNAPNIAAAGTDSNVALALSGKGTSGVNIKGIATNTAAASGDVGELVLSFVPQSASVSIPASGNVVNVTNIPLNEGDWDVWAVIYGDIGSMTQTQSFFAQINTSSATFTFPPIATTPTTGLTNIPSNPSQGFFLAIPMLPVRIPASTTVNYYLTATATFTVSTVNVYGGIWARRRR